MARISNQVNRTALHKAEQFVAALRVKGLRIDRAYLFGSYAKGHARPDSDIDVAVVSQDLSGDWLDDFCYLTRIGDEIDARMEIIPFLPQDFRDENPLVWEIKTNGIPLRRNGTNGKRRASRQRPRNKRTNRA